MNFWITRLAIGEPHPCREGMGLAIKLFPRVPRACHAGEHPLRLANIPNQKYESRVLATRVSIPCGFFLCRVFRTIHAFRDAPIRRWSRISAFENRALRVILLEDGKTVHNAFFDRNF